MYNPVELFYKDVFCDFVVVVAVLFFKDVQIHCFRTKGKTGLQTHGSQKCNGNLP